MSHDPRPIAVFDSGIGGLSILNEIRRQLPNEDILYFADQGHVPYGPRSFDEIYRFVEGITRYFLTQDVKVIVIACNTASVASLHLIRAAFPQIPIVGMEPAVKPAAEHTQRGVIGVIATQATSQSALLASVIDRFANGIEVVAQACPALVTHVELGDFNSPELYQTVRDYLKPLQEAGVDQLVIGCTHFPFLIPVIQDVMGPQVSIVDPGPAVARQAGRVIEGKRNASAHVGQVIYTTSGDRVAFYDLAQQLVMEPVEWGQIVGVTWQGEELILNAK